MTKIQPLNGRIATKEDADAGTVVFYIPSGESEPYDLGRPLPVEAFVNIDDQENSHARGTKVIIVQAELMRGDVLLGTLYNEDQELICQLSDVVLA